MSRDRTTTSYAVLGLLAIRPWTTYELAKQVQRSLRWFWPRAERKLYDEPKRLADDGLATATREHTGKRGRTVYTITEAGRAALRDWLGEPFAPPTTEFEGMVKVFFADAGSRQQLLATLERIEAQATERLDEIAASPRRDHRPSPSASTSARSGCGCSASRRRRPGAGRAGRVSRSSSGRTPPTPGAWDAAAVLAEIATVSPRGASLGS